MKKVLRICIALSLLSLTGCDFLRMVAGRPTSGQLSAKEEKLKAAKADAGADDGIVLCDSSDVFQPLSAFEEKGVQYKYDFRYGKPLTELEYRYYLIVGIYRNAETAGSHLDSARKAGFSPLCIELGDGMRAVCLAGADSPEKILEVRAAAAPGVCPPDAWVYVNER